MGGWGSSRWGAHQKKAGTNNFLEIDVRKLAKAGCLGKDRKASCSMNWGNGCALALECSADCVELRYAVAGESFHYAVQVAWTPCNFGGARPWFLCPSLRCGRRVAILYGGKHFLCRHCHNLAYPCQREELADRALRRANKIRVRAGWEPGIANFYGERPKGMHDTTYLRLMEEHLHHLRVSCMAFRARVGGMADQFVFLLLP